MAAGHLAARLSRHASGEMKFDFVGQFRAQINHLLPLSDSSTGPRPVPPSPWSSGPCRTGIGGGQERDERDEAKGTTERVVSRNLVKSRTLAVLASLNVQEHLSECRVHPCKFKGRVARVRTPSRIKEGGREGGAPNAVYERTSENCRQLTKRQ